MSLLFKRSLFFVKNISIANTGFKNVSISTPTKSINKLINTNKFIGQSSISFTHNNYIQKAFPTINKRFIHTSTNTSSSNRSKWPINSHKNVGYLCLGSSILVFGIVILGGLTRLTESGLSITEWKPVTGSIPPLNDQEWEIEFEKYKNTPEFKLLNSHITLDEFKFIFKMEWSHRLLGRIIGLTFVLPSLYYISRRKVSIPTSFKLLGICLLIGLQGGIGWWMVYSGIDSKQLEERRSKPTVSQYRLTAHLGAAFLVYCCMISTGISILKEHSIIKNPQIWLKNFQLIKSPSLKKFRLLTTGLLGLVFITAMSGGLVAGLDAGLIYNTFPHMGDDIVPSINELMSPLFARCQDQSDLIWRNMLENPTMVQLNHRILAISTFFSVLGLHLYSHNIKTIIPKQAYKWLNISMGLVLVQVTLGISTLIYLVPIELAAAHQSGALALLTSVLMVFNNLKKPSRMDQEITVELKNDIEIKGTLKSVDQYLNLKLDNISTVNNNNNESGNGSDKYPHLKAVRNLFVRGSTIRYIHLSSGLVDTNLLQDASRRESLAVSGDKILGR
ncbi:hypothetical protein CANARDRAFT_10037 [[Candida] arabinofermentans NRRL YB-2248]|uniref:Sm domain-containing protein n=1 Tax=[Candida] arabinofermentans NRRL YB-2248 TaxID=983967 RepID=A0A1E4STV6_9ASCO|nr:hypothetical protein CANARDRAFT_10037 [[Candida] arabinofermentans NRRL YB-2248]